MPNLSENKFTVQKHIINKNFRKLIDQYDARGIQSLAQNSRDYIVFASRNLHKANWEEAHANVCSIKIFQKLQEWAEVKELLRKRI